MSRGRRWLAWLHGLRKKVEIGLLASVVIAAGGLWGFIELADAVLEGETHAFDETLLVALRNPNDLSDPLGPGWVEELGRDFTALGGVGVLTLLTLAVAGFLWLERKTKAMVLVLVSVMGGLLVSTLLKQGFDRPRPDLVPHEALVYTASFPSGHSMMAAITYLTLGALLARVYGRHAVRIYLLGISLLLTVLVGISRVYLGVHWPTDVLAGWTAGAIWASLVWMATLLLQRRGEVEDEDAGDVGSAPSREQVR